MPVNKKADIAIAVFALLNLLQATFTQLTGDEALYWKYWLHLDWGFRDHPPLIGALIGPGYELFHNELGVRLLVVVSGAAMLRVMYVLSKPNSWWHFVLLFLAVPVVTLYGFIATPDAPLMLSTACYLLVWQLFLREQNMRTTLWLSISMAALVWSKYQGLFIIIFTLLPVRNIWFSRYYWAAAIGGIALYSPHIWWQVVNDLPTVKFHLNERNSDAMEWKHIIGYVAGQTVVFNPVVLGIALWITVKTKPADFFEKSLRWLIVSVLVLFQLNSMRGRVEPHWTAPLTLAAIYLIIQLWKKIPPKKWVRISLGVFASLLLAARICLVVDIVPALYRDFHRDKPKMLALHKIAGNLPVCFMNSYQNPSLYTFYTGVKAHSINNIDGGKNQYDYWNYNEYIHEKPFLNVLPYKYPGFDDVMVDGFTFHIKKETDRPVLHGLRLMTDECFHPANAGDTVKWPAWLINFNSYPLTLEGSKHSVSWYAFINHKKPNERMAHAELRGCPTEIAAHDSARVEVTFVMPDLTGSHRLCIAAQVDHLPMTYQSNWQRVEIEK